MPGPARLIHQNQLSSYNRLLRRINLIITTPRARVERQANITPQPEDLPEDWERLFDEIQQTDGVAVTRRPDGSIHVRWLRTEH